MKIDAVRALEIIDSRANPTVEAEAILASGARGRAMVPSGASVGKNEAIELRDRDDRRWRGKGVSKAVTNVNQIIGPAVKGMEAEVRSVDRALRELDGTDSKSRLGANAILSVSLAVARAIARERKIPLHSFISEISRTDEETLPTPMVNILSGGLHAGKNLDMQDFLAIPLGARSFREAMDAIGAVYHTIRSMLLERGIPVLLADEGGFGPNLASNEDALKLLSEAITRAGLDNSVAIGIDVAASHFWKDGKYVLSSERASLDGNAMVDLLDDWSSRYHILSIEDGCAEEDWQSWKKLTDRLGKKVQLIGDDLFTTNTSLIRKGISEKVANSVLIKLNQIGTLSETLDAIELCKRGGYAPVISARSGETEDPFIADLAVGTGSGQIKVGSIARSERTAKYNRLLWIERFSERKIRFSGKDPFLKHE